MKRIMIYALIFAVVLAVPVERTDVGRLRPVETVMVYKRGEDLVIRTDTDDMGIGPDAATAFVNLKSTTPAVIYLDTADFLLVSDEAIDQVEQLRQVLKPTVEMYRFEDDIDPKAASEFLSVHGNGIKLKQWEHGAQLSTVELYNQRLILS